MKQIKHTWSELITEIMTRYGVSFSELGEVEGLASGVVMKPFVNSLEETIGVSFFKRHESFNGPMKQAFCTVTSPLSSELLTTYRQECLALLERCCKDVAEQRAGPLINTTVFIDRVPEAVGRLSIYDIISNPIVIGKVSGDFGDIEVANQAFMYSCKKLAFKRCNPENNQLESRYVIDHGYLWFKEHRVLVKISLMDKKVLAEVLPALVSEALDFDRRFVRYSKVK